MVWFFLSSFHFFKKKKANSTIKQRKVAKNVIVFLLRKWKLIIKFSREKKLFRIQLFKKREHKMFTKFQELQCQKLFNFKIRKMKLFKKTNQYFFCFRALMKFSICLSAMIYPFCFFLLSWMTSVKKFPLVRFVSLGYWLKSSRQNK